MVDVVGLGHPVMDQLVNISRFPGGNSGTRAEEIFHQGGGNVATAMAAAARLGAKAGMIAKIGGDAIGDFIIKDFKYNGVDTSRILRDGPQSHSAFVIAVSEIEYGTRAFIGRGGARASPLLPEEIDYDYIASAKILHLENGGPASTAAARFARDRGIKVCIDAGYYSEDRVEIIPHIDIFIASEMFYNVMFKGREADIQKNCEEIHNAGPSVVWVTYGAKGCVGLVDGRFYEVPTFDVPVKDTTGAGDVFHGAYIAAMLEGLPHPECARYANAVSSIKCMFVGGRTGIPTRETLGRFLEDGTILTEEIEGRLDYYRRSFLEN
ncbi:MAG: carbohydrate kinase family protein [Treponema sp.]|jgi:sugar/nucleoside kinase (ribokinase family)|nr:carbohydrate kinase family protein [Treponema sp.]